MAMALGISNSLPLSPPNLNISNSNGDSFFFLARFRGGASLFTSASLLRLSTTSRRYKPLVCAASSATGSSSSDSDANPYQILGVSPIEGFEAIKLAYTRKLKDAERRGDKITASELEKAYDKVMMAQLSNRKKGVTFGSFKVSKDVKYADKMPVLPWGPRSVLSSL